jgi:hypothetical protein
MSNRLNIIFNDPVTPEQLDELLDVIIGWVEARGITIFAETGAESEIEEVGDVEENQ